MSKTAPQIEADIRAALDLLRFPVRGLYHEMRYLTEHKCDGRPGELRLNGAPLEPDMIAHMAGLSAAKVPPLLDKLSDPRVALVRRTGDGCLVLPHVNRLHEIRTSGAARKAACVGRRVLRNTQKGVTSAVGNTEVTRRVPPDGFPPHPPSLSPSPSSLGEAAAKSFADAGVTGVGAVARPKPPPVSTAVDDDGSRAIVDLAKPVDVSTGDDLDAQIRRKIADHRGLMLDARTAAKARQLVDAVGWDRAWELVEQGIVDRKTFPVGWALSVGAAEAAGSRQRAARRRTSGPSPPPPLPAHQRPNVRIIGKV